ncbi:MAG: PhzF family phenazine biosynthesis protein [Burkholderiales bacterium]
MMQKIASENNLSETAFFVQKSTTTYHIRWFTPKVEVDLCGHATLAASYVIFNYLTTNENKIIFNSRSGDLTASQNSDNITLDFPIATFNKCETYDANLINSLKVKPVDVLKGDDYMVVVESQKIVEDCMPDFNLMANINTRGVIITARGDKVDFVSRWFGPRVGVPEDPVTGSAHCMLAPYWGAELNKNKLDAEPLSSRLGKLTCELNNQRVFLTGRAIPYFNGDINIPE